MVERGGSFRVRGRARERLEGDAVLPDAAFVIAFRDREKARTFWCSDRFQRLAVLRRSGSQMPFW
ncbi:MAG: DUF1330 domain-containing protein [Sulfitobacter sp.]